MFTREGTVLWIRRFCAASSYWCKVSQAAKQLSWIWCCRRWWCWWRWLVCLTRRKQQWTRRPWLEKKEKEKKIATKKLKKATLNHISPTKPTKTFFFSSNTYLWSWSWYCTTNRCRTREFCSWRWLEEKQRITAVTCWIRSCWKHDSCITWTCLWHCWETFDFNLLCIYMLKLHEWPQLVLSYTF